MTIHWDIGFSQKISKIISKPSITELQSIFQDRDQGASGYLPTDAEGTTELEPSPEPSPTPNPEPTPIPNETEKSPQTQPKEEAKTANHSIETDLFSRKGNKRLIGKEGITNYIFEGNKKLSRNNADIIINFKPKEGDKIWLDKMHMVRNKTRLAQCNSMNRLKKLAKTNRELIYFKKSGFLYINGNGKDDWMGEPDEGGLLGILKGKPQLKNNHINLF